MFLKSGQEIAAEDLERVLAYVEQAVDSDRPFDTESEAELHAAGRKLPPDILREIAFAVRCLKLTLPPLAGKTLVVTGVDRAGKETHCFNPRRVRKVHAIKDFLTRRSYRVMSIAQPSYDTLLGSLVGAYLGVESQGVSISGQLSRDTAWVLWSLDRGQHNDRAIKWLRSGSKNIVLAKRWTESNVVYQKANGLDEQRVLRFERNMVKPDYVLVLDIPINIVFDRINRSQRGRDHYEDAIFLGKVHQLYLNLPQYYPYGEIFLIDAARPPELVNRDIIDLLKRIGF